MNILVIGNGFDLAHGLPTKYTNFLDFVKVIRQIIKMKSIYDLQTIDWNNISSRVKEIIVNNTGNERNNLFSQEKLWKELLDDNIWIDYFIQNTMYQKENWIDFESEIGKVIKSLDFDMKENKGKYELDDNMDRLSNDYLSKFYSKFSHAVRSIGALTDTDYGTITYRQIRDRLQKDLNKLIRALEIYLTEYVGKIECNIISPDIKKIASEIIESKDGTKGVLYSNVLCFNYTNTYEKIYLKKGNWDDYIDYIHGKADINNTIATNNMVLGIDEYLPDKRKNDDIEFIAFKKFYQRIHKETGCRYKEWVEDIREEYEEYLHRKEAAMVRANRYTENSMQAMINRIAASAIKDEKCRKHHLYIFGHSLDVTDGDILRDLILNDNVFTTIYYLNKDVYGQQIANLVKVIGQDELIKRTGGNTKTIKFKQQQDMVEIQNESN